MQPDPRWLSFEAFIASLPTGGRIAELGVWRGGPARTIFDLVEPDHMYLVDWWAPYSTSVTSVEDWAKVRQQAHDRFAKEIKARRVQVIEDDFVAAALRVPCKSLDFIRHNGDERGPQVTRVLNAWWRTLKPGGLWMAHGWTVDAWHDVPNAILSFARRYAGVRIEGILRDCSHIVLRKAECE